MATVIDGSASVTINSGAVLGITSGTAVASTSGTSITFSSIPSWVKRVTILLRAVISSGGSNFQIQVGAGSVTTSGYVGNVVQTGAGTATVSFTSGLGVTATTASTLATTGMIVFTSFGSNTWSGVAVTTRSDGYAQTGGTTVALSGLLDRVRLTTVNGTDTFTAGSINILYEG
jgi:hypothetical protein